jgi:uncharacterized protein involved in exopolysaccharide biosynthesis
VTQTVLIELQAREQAASDRLADALAAGEDTTEARQDLDEIRRARQAHQDGVAAALRDRQSAQVAEADHVANVAAEQATSAVAAAVARVQLPAGVEAPAPAQHPLVAEAAAECARLRLEIERGEPERQKVRNEVDALVKRADSKRHEAAAIRSRRLAGHEQPDDAATLTLLTADADDLDGLAAAARQRVHALEQPVAALRQRLVAAEQKLKAAQVEGALHAIADRARLLEQHLVDAVRELRRGVFTVGNKNLPSYYVAGEDLRKVTLGTLA